MGDIELMEEMDQKFFARCVWQEEDLDNVDGIENLPDEMRGTFMDYIARTLEDIMTSTGWDALSDGLSIFLREHGIEPDRPIIDQEDLELLSMHEEE